jgi:hypothetical protein
MSINYTQYDFVVYSGRMLKQADEHIFVIVRSLLF